MTITFTCCVWCGYEHELGAPCRHPIRHGKRQAGTLTVTRVHRRKGSRSTIRLTDPNGACTFTKHDPRQLLLFPNGA